VGPTRVNTRVNPEVRFCLQTPDFISSLSMAASIEQYADRSALTAVEREMRLKSALRYLIFLFEIDTLLGAKVAEPNSNADTTLLLRKHAPPSLSKLDASQVGVALSHISLRN